MRRQLLAWQGFSMVVPETWEVSVQEGNAKRGYLRFDDLESVRAQMRWARSRRSVTVQQLVEDMARQFEDDARRSRHTIEFRRESRLVVPDGDDADSFQCFECTGDERMVGIAHKRTGERRAVLVSLPDDGQEDFRAEAKRVLKSVRDVVDAADRPWAMYGFQVVLPRGYALRDSQLQAGRLVFDFLGKGRTAKASRLSAANVVLKESSLGEWFKNDQLKHLKADRAKPVELEYRGCRAIEVRIEKWRFLRSREVTCCRAWHSEEDNALYVAFWQGGAENEGEFTAFADSVGNGYVEG